MKAIIGLVGEKGAGKETVISMITELVGHKHVCHEQFSSILFETLQAWGIPATRANLQKLAVVMNEGYGDGTLARAVKNRLGTIDRDLVLLEGIRWDADVALVKSFEKSMLIYVTATPRLRFERTRLRGHKVGESEATFEQFLHEEQAPNEIHIARIGATARATIVNDGTLADLKKAVRMIFDHEVSPMLH